jgi:antitoxin Phd
MQRIAMVRHWPVQTAKARLSELLDACVRDGAQIVTKRGAEMAVVAPIAEWRRLQAASGQSLKDLLLADEPRAELDIPPRGGRQRRGPADIA